MTDTPEQLAEYYRSERHKMVLNKWELIGDIPVTYYTPLDYPGSVPMSITRDDPEVGDTYVMYQGKYYVL